LHADRDRRFQSKLHVSIKCIDHTYEQSYFFVDGFSRVVQIK
jgi:hypothetical protein